MLKVFLWFNPLIYLMRSAIKLNHEFLADKTVLNKNFDPVDYQNAILSFSTLDDQEKIHQPSLANAIDYSSTRHALGVIKKRFTVMKIQTSKTAVFIRSMLLLPLTALVLFGFSNKVAIPVAKELQPELYSIHLQEKASGEMMARYTTLAKKYNLQPLETRVVPPEDLRTLETIYNKMTEGQKRNAQPFPECLPPQKKPQDGASKKQLKEYNTLARKYNAMSRNDFHVIGREVKRIKHIYDLMTEAQKETAEPFPDFPEPPPPPPAPAAPQADGIVVIASSPQSPVSSPHVTAEVSPPPPPPPSPTAPDAVVVADHIPAPPSPPIPPEPRSPADFARDMAEQNAEFYYNGEKISAARAIELLENSEHINLRARHTGLKNPVVELSTSPLEIKEDQ
jgi:hypothetical protein